MGHRYRKLREEKEQREESWRKNVKINSFFTRTKRTPSGGDSSVDTNENFHQDDQDEPGFELTDDELNELTPQVGPSCSRDITAALEP